VSRLVLLLSMVNATTKANALDAEPIKASAVKDLLDVVDSVRGKKALILDTSLTGPLGLVVKFPVLRDHGIDKVYHLEPNPLTVTHDKIIYLCRPTQRNAEMILGYTLSFVSDACRADEREAFRPAAVWDSRIPRVLRPSQDERMCQHL
jgi:Sec1 family